MAQRRLYRALLRHTNACIVKNHDYALLSFAFLVLPSLKQCSKCGATKPTSDFYKASSALSGLSSQCRACDSETKAASKRRNPRTTQLSQMVSDSKRRAKKKQLDHDIDSNYLESIAPLRCPYLDIELRWHSQYGTGVMNRPFPNSPSLDRIDSSKGYVKGNVIIVSHRANAIKHNASEQELIEIGRRLAALKMQLVCQELCTGA